MTEGANSGLGTAWAADFAAALDWWREAGVDGDLGDAPQRWIAPVEPVPDSSPVTSPSASLGLAPPAPAAAPLPQPQLDRSGWPQDLAAFAPWWLSEPWLDGGQTDARVPPRGASHAELMVLVAEPERDDGEVLFAGAQGRLITGLLAAAGIAPDAAYIASVLPRHTPHADWPGMAARGMGEVARHHIALASPQRLLILGSNILPLVSNDPAKNPAPFSQFHLEEATIPLLAARELAVLLGRPQWKAELWRNWLEWTAPLAPSPGATETGHR